MLLKNNVRQCLLTFLPSMVVILAFVMALFGAVILGHHRKPYHLKLAATALLEIS